MFMRSMVLYGALVTTVTIGLGNPILLPQPLTA